MNTKAILATDLSGASDLLIDCSDYYKKLGIEKITLFHSLGVEYMNFYGYVNLENTKTKLDIQKKKLESQGFEVETIIKEGLPYYELKAFVENDNETLLILGNKGNGYLKEITLGSTANFLIKKVNNPILIMKCNQESNDISFKPKLSCNSDFGNVIFTTDFSENSEKAFNYLQSIVNDSFKEIALVNVLESSSNLTFKSEGENLRTTNKVLLEDLKKQLSGKSNAQINTVILEGNPTSELLGFIEKSPASLLIMGKHGQGLFSQLIVGSVTRRMIEETKMNCLIIPNN